MKKVVNLLSGVGGEVIDEPNIKEKKVQDHWKDGKFLHGDVCVLHMTGLRTPGSKKKKKNCLLSPGGKPGSILGYITRTPEVGRVSSSVSGVPVDGTSVSRLWDQLLGEKPAMSAV